MRQASSPQKGLIHLESRAAVSAGSPGDAEKASAWRVTAGAKQGHRSPLRSSRGNKKEAILCTSHALQPRLSCIYSFKKCNRSYMPPPLQQCFFYNPPSRILNRSASSHLLLSVSAARLRRTHPSTLRSVCLWPWEVVLQWPHESGPRSPLPLLQLKRGGKTERLEKRKWIERIFLFTGAWM